MMLSLKNFTMAFIAFAVGAVIVAGCGDGGKAAAEQARQDSIRIANEAAEAQKRVEDSIAALPKNIAEVAMSNADFSTLVAALQAGELAGVFQGEEKFTVFAPVNTAFAEIQTTVDELLKPENKGKLQSVLKYHVVAGAVRSSDLTNGQKVATLQGEELTVSIADGKVMIGNAEVISADVEASNGFIHVINKVLVPKKM
jgi:uncharacterized surface protein with fasciclin (FAS1) repeats